MGKTFKFNSESVIHEQIVTEASIANLETEKRAYKIVSVPLSIHNTLIWINRITDLSIGTTHYEISERDEKAKRTKCFNCFEEDFED